ncbi:hypothetical protein LMH87_002646 [Akanthomyces muscarius]|uniref:Uncharacterized protein n=1 Tax=Akanthomyces muscarius TaxID=2231603 RepID=A0A9W8UJN0_AKAMU|nr:hypothetical protein LMH87_002646 [Akanthomyces muscarius]KAJ4148164.1 hypothetical protein LMH87_002646 [Akanthomyces muscarius]
MLKPVPSETRTTVPSFSPPRGLFSAGSCMYRERPRTNPATLPSLEAEKLRQKRSPCFVFRDDKATQNQAPISRRPDPLIGCTKTQAILVLRAIRFIPVKFPHRRRREPPPPSEHPRSLRWWRAAGGGIDSPFGKGSSCRQWIVAQRKKAT